MIRADLHIHTVPSPLDVQFSFNIEALKQHVDQNKLDIIGITNHNLFDKANYNIVASALPDVYVLPGIEVSVEGYHVLVLYSPDDIDLLISRSNSVKKCKQGEKGIALSAFLGCFACDDTLIIPHYGKAPAINKAALRTMGKTVSALEVGSDKKWVQANREGLGKPIVLFSDFRAFLDEKNRSLGRYTYIDIEEASFDSLRLAFSDSAKFNITELEGTFELQPGLFASTGLNVVVGARSSGKTHILETLASSYGEEAKYIKQFEIVKKASDDSFDAEVEKSARERMVSYCSELKGLMDKARELPTGSTSNKDLADYVHMLKSYANSTSLEDTYSKCTLYSSSKLPLLSDSGQEKAVRAVVDLLESRELEEAIERIVGRAAMIELFSEALAIYKKAAEATIVRERANGLLTSIKQQLSSESSMPECPDSPLVACAKRKAFINRLNNLRNNISLPLVVSREEVGQFQRIMTRRPYRNLTELKGELGISSGVQGILSPDSDDYLETLINRFPDTNLEKAFFKLEVSLVNSRNEPVSGGQRAEYLFLQAIKNAAAYDLVLIDEPESSFDNPFLCSFIAEQLKHLSECSTVFVATHNNILGVSSKADWIVHASVDSNGNHVVHSGCATSSTLTDADGNTISRPDALLEMMEAGQPSYEERRQYYALTEH